MIIHFVANARLKKTDTALATIEEPISLLIVR